ncbi:amidohydrolase [Phenylobacterium sp.]|uniref:amidohydrolase n=1 Tax=Phenylobacterium sp. TaxID=1871053 RepID=UPI00356A7279
MTLPPADLSRRALMGVAAAATLAPAASAAATASDAYVLRNVRLETGYDHDADGVSGTKTALFDVRIAGGRIAAVTPAGGPKPAGRAYDAGGLLMLPAFRDMHIHLDKTFYGDPWRPPRLKKNGIPGQIAIEQRLLPGMLPGVEAHADRLVNLLQSKGATFARSQCNVDPVVGIQNLVRLKRALDRRDPTFGHEIVAFPQHGLVSVHLEQTMREAMAAGATHVGGIDPTAVDGGLERSVDTVLQIALDAKAPIDMHLHEPAETGIAAIKRIAARVEQEPSLKGRVTFSHCFCLMSLDDAEAADMASLMAHAGMSVASTVPMGRKVMPIPILLAKGVPVYMGTDTVVDFWGVFGQCDVLLKAWIACQMYGWSDEFGLSQALRLATGGPVPLSPTGEQLWPRPGDPADVVLVRTSCAAETVARMPPRETVLHRGVLAAGAFPRAA